MDKLKQSENMKICAYLWAKQNICECKHKWLWVGGGVKSSCCPSNLILNVDDKTCGNCSKIHKTPYLRNLNV